VGTDLGLVVRAVPEPGDGLVHAPDSGRGGLTVPSACGRVVGGVTAPVRRRRRRVGLIARPLASPATPRFAVDR
jgi:hypothetical protein